MTFITLEGASAVGKTTIAEPLCDVFDTYRVPGVNALLLDVLDAMFDWAEEAVPS